MLSQRITWRAPFFVYAYLRIGEKYWGEGLSDVLHSFITPAAGKAGGTGPALVDSAAASSGRLGPSVLTAEQGQPPRTSDMAPFI